MAVAWKHRKGPGRTATRAALRHFHAAAVLHRHAQTPSRLHSAAVALHAAYGAAPNGSRLERRLRDRLALLLCQEKLCTRSQLDALLAEGPYLVRLSTAVLRYPFRSPGLNGETPAGSVHALDGALPQGMFHQLQEALNPNSIFWRAHGYKCGISPFFSYVHHLDGPPRSALDRVIRQLHKQVAIAFPRAATATRAEWWAHCRPHHTGHQLHFDSDDEGRGGVRHPIVSVALYLTDGVGGPTLVTDQHATRSSLCLPSAGWAILPAANRAVMFDGSLLHAVIPGRGFALQANGGVARRRVSLMVAFWSAIRERPGLELGSARPFPYPDVDASFAGDGKNPGAAWPKLFDWAQEKDSKCERTRASGVVAANHSVACPDASSSGTNASWRAQDAVGKLWRVRPIWEPVGSGHNGLPNRMPSYDECFQGF